MTDLSSGWEINGWGYVTNGTDVMWFAFEDWSFDLDPSPSITHFAADYQYGYDMGKRVRKVKFKNCLFGAKADIEEFISTIDTWQDSGTFTLKVKTISTPAYFKFDGTNTTLTVLWGGTKGITKLSKGDVQMYGAKTVKFEQAG